LWVLTEIKNRGVRDVCLLVCDGLKGLPDAVSAVWEKTIVQTCIVHYPDTVVMPIPGRPVLAGGGARVRDIGITGRAAA
jgi:putative transposase